MIFSNRKNPAYPGTNWTIGRPQPYKAGMGSRRATPMEITPAMVAAGASVISDQFFDLAPPGSWEAENAAKKVFSAMIATKPKPHPQSPSAKKAAKKAKAKK